jgi:hypothetical protein
MKRIVVPVISAWQAQALKVWGILFMVITAQAAPSIQLPIGMNVPSNNYYSTSLIFNDVMKTASNWITFNASGQSDWNTGLLDQISLDSNGYPLQIPHAVSGEPDQAVRFLINNFYADKYVVLYDGVGDLTVHNAVSYKENDRLYIELNGQGGHVWLHIVQSQLGDHLRNIRIIPIEFEQNEQQMPRFYTPFLDGLRPFHALRFMDWMNTNNSKQELWQDRVTPSYFSQGAGHGISIEHAIELANLLQQDAWFCIPHLASDEYIRAFARLVRDSLDKDLKIYLEYSNEIWNWQFSQATFVNTNAPGHANEYVSQDLAAIRSDPGDHPEKGAYMMARVYRLWREEFGEQAFSERVLRVAAGQAGWYDTFRRIVEYLFDELQEGADIFSPTAYFNFTKDHHEEWNAMPPAQVTAAMIIDSVAARWPQVEQDKVRLGALASQYGMSVGVYEGGQHMQPYLQGEFDYNQAVWDAQIHPGMYDLYMENFRIMTLPDVNTSIFMAFSYVSVRESRYGSWGHLESLDQVYATNLREIAPKYQALLDVNTPRASTEPPVSIVPNYKGQSQEGMQVYVQQNVLHVYMQQNALPQQYSEQKVQFGLWDINGKLLLQQVLPHTGNAWSGTIPLAQYPSGVGYITIQTGPKVHRVLPVRL